ncbi:MAG TPA: cbb3-type cytochrome c oxidase subunit I [Gallionella sp.]|nr:cbb3-type cytochrome c oxidase subunit I [Gallionella sp.]
MIAANNAQDTPLVNRELVKAWLAWALVWSTVFPLVGLLVSIKFNVPTFLGETSWLTFGRMRPVHVNGVIFGAFSAPMLGLLYYMVPKLCGRPMVAERLGWWTLYGWNLFLIVGSISLLMGYNSGFEAAEYPWPANILRYAVLSVVTYQALATIFRRKETGFYVALWYLMAALVWTLLNLILGGVILPYLPMSGMSNTTLHGLYIHYVVGLWITPAGLAVMYYFMPVAAKNALYSHRISLLGFWSLALFYPFVGLHHYVFSPIPYQHQTISIMTSMMLIVPVWAVVTNIFGTAKGYWGEILGGNTADNYSAKFILLSALYYLIACFQGSTEALRRMQEITHFSDFVIAHSHGTIFGTFVIGVVGGMYYVWPRVTGRQLWSAKLASWHLWLTITGSALMFIGLAAQGFIQGSMLEYGANFVDTVKEMKPWWVARTLAGATMDIGLVLMMVNFYCTARYGKPFEEPYPEVSKRLEVKPAGERKDWLGRPSTVFLVAGLGFFAAAVLMQGLMPSMTMEATSNQVKDEATGLPIRAADYTPLEKRGRQVYIREGCWYCHSQYIRPVTGETMRWGPLSQAGEYAWDQPQMLGTRRIGPDLTRIGRKYGDDWHVAHHWDPRHVVPDSVMPRFPWLFETGKGGVPTYNEDGKALLAYIQRLGTGVGDWRESFAPTRLSAGDSAQTSTADKEALLKLGEQVYQRRCIGCHGAEGDGKGVSAAQFGIKPRNFTTGIFKFHSTPGADALPTDQDLFVTVSHGLWGTPMPPWYDLSAEQRMAVIQFIKTFSMRWLTEEVQAPVAVPPEPEVSMKSINHGHELYATICAFCHGEGGHGDGIAGAALTDTWGNPVKPANYTLPAGAPGGVKLGHDGRHLFLTVMNGVGGTPMPAFAANLSPQDVWDVVHFIQSLRVDAHLKELQRAGLPALKVQEARLKLWQDISAAAAKSGIDAAVR